MNYHFTLTDNHIIANINGKKCLIDTGSPMTIGNQNLQIAGHDFTCIDSFMGVSLESLPKSVGTDLDYLIGSDVLSSFIVDIDWEKKTDYFE